MIDLSKYNIVNGVAYPKAQKKQKKVEVVKCDIDKKALTGGNDEEDNQTVHESED